MVAGGGLDTSNLPIVATEITTWGSNLSYPAWFKIAPWD